MVLVSEANEVDPNQEAHHVHEMWKQDEYSPRDLPGQDPGLYPDPVQELPGWKLGPPKEPPTNLGGSHFAPNKPMKITDEQVVVIRERAAGGATFSELAEEYDVSPMQISNICRGKQRTDVGGPLCGPRTGGAPAALTDEEAVQARIRADSGETYQSIAEDMEVSAFVVSRVCRGISNTAAPGPIQSPRKPGRKRLTDSQVAEIRKQAEEGAFYADLAEAYSVSYKHIGLICRGLARGNVGGPTQEKRTDEGYNPRE